MELDTVNRLFLELSQIATATTRKELHYEAALRSILEAPADTDGTASMRMRLMAKEALRTGISKGNIHHTQNESTH